MRPQSRALPRNGFFGAADRRGKSDAVLRPLDIIVHGFRNADDAYSLGVQLFRKAERVVPADGDEIVQTEMGDVVEYDRREVVCFFGGAQRFSFLGSQVLRQT